MITKSVGPSFKSVKVDYKKINALGKKAEEGVKQAIPEIEKLSQNYAVKITGGFCINPNSIDDMDYFMPSDDICVSVRAKGLKGFVTWTKGFDGLSFTDNYDPSNIIKTVKKAIREVDKSLNK